MQSLQTKEVSLPLRRQALSLTGNISFLSFAGSDVTDSSHVGIAQTEV
jgi:hypothetical protein